MCPLQNQPGRVTCAMDGIYTYLHVFLTYYPITFTHTHTHTDSIRENKCRSSVVLCLTHLIRILLTKWRRYKLCVYFFSFSSLVRPPSYSDCFYTCVYVCMYACLYPFYWILMLVCVLYTCMCVSFLYVCTFVCLPFDL